MYTLSMSGKTKFVHWDRAHKTMTIIFVVGWVMLTTSLVGWYLFTVKMRPERTEGVIVGKKLDDADYRQCIASIDYPSPIRGQRKCAKFSPQYIYTIAYRIGEEEIEFQQKPFSYQKVLLSYEIGKRLAVRYDPQAPEDARVELFSYMNLDIFLIASVVAGGALFLFLARI